MSNTLQWNMVQEDVLVIPVCIDRCWTVIALDRRVCLVAIFDLSSTLSERWEAVMDVSSQNLGRLWVALCPEGGGG